MREENGDTLNQMGRDGGVGSHQSPASTHRSENQPLPARAIIAASTYHLHVASPLPCLGGMHLIAQLPRLALPAARNNAGTLSSTHRVRVLATAPSPTALLRTPSRPPAFHPAALAPRRCRPPMGPGPSRDASAGAAAGRPGSARPGPGGGAAEAPPPPMTRASRSFSPFGDSGVSLLGPLRSFTNPPQVWTRTGGTNCSSVHANPPF